MCAQQHHPPASAWVHHSKSAAHQTSQPWGLSRQEVEQYQQQKAHHPCHLRALLQGVPERDVGPEALELLRRVGLPAEMALRAAHTYSGGNKRKLSLALALAGRPAAVLLDEPSSGAHGIGVQGPGVDS